MNKSGSNRQNAFILADSNGLRPDLLEASNAAVLAFGLGVMMVDFQGKDGEEETPDAEYEPSEYDKIEEIVLTLDVGLR